MNKVMNNNNNNKIGKVLLISYNESSFLETVRENTGAGLVDARKDGWSRDESLKAEALKAEFGKRYKHAPELSVKAGEALSEYLARIKATIKTIKVKIESGKGIIVTHWDVKFLKLLGAIIIDAIGTDVLLQWSNAESNEGGISKQRGLTKAEFERRYKELTKPFDEAGHFEW